MRKKVYSASITPLAAEGGLDVEGASTPIIMLI